ncbi:GNAT family N-acetyltransferase [Niveibacterium sp. SC-1]|uniref:GNAT family N-acetyltransferase n=1 Tax=Niveibacterium sp. SC-1 TaxID=3135646 RepID=UPI003120176A
MSRIEINLARQSLSLLDEQGALVEGFPVSTAALGAGERENSYRTPRGRHRVHACIGDGAAAGAVFVARQPTGEVWSPALAAAHPERDWILTRILWLEGEEPGHNQGPGVDSHQRYIYIHGTPDDQPMGVPASHGCVRMRNEDLLRLFPRVEAGMRVEIVTGLPEALQLECGDWATMEALTYPIRETVFVVEQGVPTEMERDEWDGRSQHLLASLAGRAVGTARLLPDGHVGRLAVLPGARGLGVGQALMRRMHELALERGMSTLVLHAQIQAEDFYRALGYLPEGEVFMEAGIPHLTMRRRLA